MKVKIKNILALIALLLTISILPVAFYITGATEVALVFLFVQILICLLMLGSNLNN